MSAGVVRLGRRPLTSGQAAKSALSLTRAAIDRLQYLSKQNPQKPFTRLAVRTRGCSGKSYTLDLVDKSEKNDEVVEVEGVKVFVDPKALLYVVGTEMDYVKDDVQEGFVFFNPIAKATCGCNESFAV